MPLPILPFPSCNTKIILHDVKQTSPEVRHKVSLTCLFAFWVYSGKKVQIGQYGSNAHAFLLNSVFWAHTLGCSDSLQLCLLNPKVHMVSTPKSTLVEHLLHPEFSCPWLLLCLVSSYPLSSYRYHSSSPLPSTALNSLSSSRHSTCSAVAVFSLWHKTPNKSNWRTERLVWLPDGQYSQPITVGKAGEQLITLYARLLSFVVSPAPWPTEQYCPYWGWVFHLN